MRTAWLNQFKLWEWQTTEATVCEKLREGAAGKRSSLVAVAEGVKLPRRAPTATRFPRRATARCILIGDAIHKLLKQDVRVTVLGHIQRGESSSPFDQIPATHFGVDAVELVARGEFGRMVCLRAREIESVPLGEAVGETRLVDPEGSMVRTARSVGLTFGDH